MSLENEKKDLTKEQKEMWEQIELQSIPLGGWSPLDGIENIATAIADAIRQWRLERSLKKQAKSAKIK